eukprot:6178882-Pleurochrysis_carterae.AAC.2
MLLPCGARSLRLVVPRALSVCDPVSARSVPAGRCAKAASDLQTDLRLRALGRLRDRLPRHAEGKVLLRNVKQAATTGTTVKESSI